MRIKAILISLAAALLMSVSAFAQDVTVKGVVTDADGQPIPGVAVVAKTSTSSIGQVTDVDGKYSISVPSSVRSLTFSILGYEEVTASVNGSSPVNVTLQESALFLEEAVSIGMPK